MNRLRQLVLCMIILIIVSCQDDEANQNIEPQSCLDEIAFCTHIANLDIDSTGTIINTFLKTIEDETSGTKLEHLKDWLECKKCVDSANIICESCIDVDPPISEIEVQFKINGSIQVEILDIVMSEPLRFYTYH